MKTLTILILPVLLFLLLIDFAFGQSNKSEGTSDWEDGIITLRSDDGKFITRFDVRMYINGAYFFENKNELSSGTHLRKGRFGMKTKLWDTWQGEWDIDIAEGIVETKDMFFSYTGFRNSHIQVGHFKMPLGLNELTSSRFQTFIERAYAMLAFETDRHIGIEYSRWGYQWNFRGAVFGQTLDTQKNKTKDETGGGAAARLVVAPIRTENSLLHTGLAAVYQNPDDETNVVDFASEPETKIGDVEILDTGTIFDVDYTAKLGLEFAFTHKNFSFQSEYIRTNVIRLNDQPNAMFDGGYAFASWILTGEQRPWVEQWGEFWQVIPKNNNIGAWELAARYSHLNLTDTNAGILGGKANNYTIALNWYANPNVRIMLNYTMVYTSENATGNGFIGGDNFSVLHAMALVYF